MPLACKAAFEQCNNALNSTDRIMMIHKISRLIGSHATFTYNFLICMGVPSEISLPTNKPDIRQNLWEEVRWSQIRLDQPLEQEGRKEIRLDQPSWGRLGWDSMLFYWIYHSITLNPIQDWSSLICFLPFFCSGTMNGDLLNLRPPPPHFPLIQSNEFMPEIQGKKRAPTGLPSRF